RGWGKGYMSKGGLEVNALKKKKIDEVPIRKSTITFANNLLEDPDQGLELDALINLEENMQREKERRSKAKHAPLVLDKEVNKEVDEAYNAQLKFKLEAPGEGSSAVPDSLDHSDSLDSSIWESSDDDKTESDNDYDNGDNDDQTDQFGVLVHGNEQAQPKPQHHSPSVTTTSQEDVSRYFNESLEVEMTYLLNEPMYTKTQTLMVVPLIDTIPEVQEETTNDQLMESPPAVTTKTPLTKSQKKQVKKLLRKAIIVTLALFLRFECSNLVH
ncbi:hypothetical protein Tco_1281531, partial [Tanacetum coccineum]